MKKSIFIIGTIFLFSCGGNTNEKKNEDDSIKVAETIVDNHPKKEIYEDFAKSAELFVNEVLKEKIRVDTFRQNDLKKVKFFEVFLKEGLDKITAYSNKNYPKSSEPNYYEHFVLFVVTYKSEKDALSCYNEIKSYLKYKHSDISDLEENLARKVSIMTNGAKPVGLITQKGKQVFSLVETCRNTPIGGKWIDYEGKFLTFITKDGEDIEVLNSDCGMFNYKKEIRKASR